MPPAEWHQMVPDAPGVAKQKLPNSSILVREVAISLVKLLEDSDSKLVFTNAEIMSNVSDETRALPFSPAQIRRVMAGISYNPVVVAARHQAQLRVSAKYRGHASAPAPPPALMSPSASTAALVTNGTMDGAAESAATFVDALKSGAITADDIVGALLSRFRRGAGRDTVVLPVHVGLQGFEDVKEEQAPRPIGLLQALTSCSAAREQVRTPSARARAQTFRVHMLFGLHMLCVPCVCDGHR